MEPLRQKDFKSLLELLRGCYAAPDLDAFVACLLHEIPKVVPCEIAVFNEYNPSRLRVHYIVEPREADPPGSEAILNLHMREHPIATYYRRTRDTSTTKFSDFLSKRQYHRLGLYNEFFRRAYPSVEDLIAAHFPNRPSFVAAPSLCRHSQDFTERDRLLMNLLRPHLMQAYLNAEAFDQIGKQLAQANHALEIPDQGIVILGKDGRIRLITERGRKWLAEYFGKASGLGKHLPEGLLRWVKHQESMLGRKETFPHPRKPLVVEHEGRSVVVRLISEPEQTLLLLEDRRTALEPEALEPLGLSRREAEVLALVALGKSNAEIAALLDMKPKTVEKHLERIFQKLGVESRTAAAMRALTSIRYLER